MAPLEVRLEPLPGEIVGTITNANTGAPIADATVALGAWRAASGADGRYRLDGLTPGTHTVKVTAEGYRVRQFEATIGPGTSAAIDVALTPLRPTLVVRVVDAATGEALAGATIGYGPVPDAAGDGADEDDDLPCADVRLLVPLKRSAEFGAIRRRVADPHHLDSWQEDGLHFFVFLLHPAVPAAGPPGANGAATGSAADDAPVAVFAMDPASRAPVSAVVVTPGPGGEHAEIVDLRAIGPAASAPVAVRAVPR